MFSDFIASFWISYILLKAREEELIIWRIDGCSLLLWAIYEVLQMGRKWKREDVNSGLGGNRNLGPPEWQASVLAVNIILINIPFTVMYVAYHLFQLCTSLFMYVNHLCILCAISYLPRISFGLQQAWKASQHPWQRLFKYALKSSQQPGQRLLKYVIPNYVYERGSVFL